MGEKKDVVKEKKNPPAVLSVNLGRKLESEDAGTWN